MLPHQANIPSVHSHLTLLHFQLHGTHMHRHQHLELCQVMNQLRAFLTSV